MTEQDVNMHRLVPTDDHEDILIVTGVRPVYRSCSNAATV